MNNFYTKINNWISEVKIKVKCRKIVLVIQSIEKYVVTFYVKLGSNNKSLLLKFLRKLGNTNTHKVYKFYS